MPRKAPITLKEYVAKLNYYRFEFMKFSSEYIERKEKFFVKCTDECTGFNAAKHECNGMCLSEENVDSILKPEFRKMVPDITGKVRMTDGDHVEQMTIAGDIVIAESDPPKPIIFSLEVNPYATIDELNKLLDKFQKDTIRQFKAAKKHGYAGTQTSFIVDDRGKVDFFRICETAEPFSYWERLIQAYRLYKAGKTFAAIGKELQESYGHIESLVRAASADIREAERLIDCSKYDSFPYDPAGGNGADMPQPKLRPTSAAMEAFRRKQQERSVKAAKAALPPRNKK